MGRLSKGVLFLLFFAAVCFLNGLAFGQTLFGPQQYALTTTTPQTFSAVISATAGPAHLHVVNGNPDGSNRLTHASIKLNGFEVVGPEEFGADVALVDEPVTLLSTNTLTVTLTGPINGTLTVSIERRAASITSVTPSSGRQGETLTVTVVGFNTNFTQGFTQLSAGPGISVGGAPPGEFGPVTVQDATHLTATLSISSTTFLGPRTLVAKTNGEKAALFQGFTVLAGTPAIAGTSVTTLAGAGTAGLLDGPGSTAQFRFPFDVAPRLDGSAVVADTVNSRLRNIGPDGTVSTVTLPVTLILPTGVTIDSLGRTVIADTGRCVIRIVGIDGAVTTIGTAGSCGFADGPPGTARFKFPRDVVADASGNIFVADTGNFRVRKIAPDGTVTTLAGSGAFGNTDGPAATATFGLLNGIAVAFNGTVFVSDSVFHKIRQIDPAGTVSTVAGTGVAGFADGFASSAQFAFPTGLTLDGTGNLYIADTLNNLIRRLIPGGIVETVAGTGARGSEDGPGTSATFSLPFGVGLPTDSAGRIFIADTFNHKIRVVQAKPVIHSINPVSAIHGSTFILTVNGEALSGATAVTFLRNGIADLNITTSGISVNALGTQLTATVNIAAAAALGQRTVTVTTQGGTSDATPSAANTFTVLGQITLSPATQTLKIGRTGTLNISLSAAPPGGAGVNLTSSFPAVATVSTPVNIPAGFTSGTATVTAVAQGTTNITASAFGFASGVASVTVVPNRPPTLSPIGNKTAPLGQTLTFTVAASDPDGDPVTLSVAPLPLPANATFDRITGRFTFTPSTNQVGSFTLTFSATDGELTTSETITITVPAPDPAGVTSLSGRILDANAFNLGQTIPVVGAVVSILGSGISAKSDANGNFALSAVPSGSQVFDINASTAALAPDGSPYAGFREEISLIANVTNVVDRPFFLPRIDRASLTTVNPNVTTVVTNPNLGVTLTVPPHTAKNPDGTDFTGQLSISLAPRNLAPAALPDFLDPGLLITIQPVGVTFSTPLQITFPNIDNLTPGSEVDIWSLAAEQGIFVVVGTGRVSADGTKIETISGGIRAADWHAVMPPGGSSNTDVDESDGLVQDPSKQCTPKVSSTVALQNGCLGVDFALPSYRSLGSSRSLKFIYKSNRANPQPVIPFNATIPVRAAVPPKISYKLSVAGVDQGVETFVNTSGLNENIDETIRNAISFDASTFKTGVYPYSIRLTSNYPQSRISSTISDRVMVVNEQKSSFGAGWGIEGLGRLNFNADGSVVVTDGNGSAVLFRQPSLGLVSWWLGEGDANDTAGANHGTLQNGATFATGKVGKAFSFDGVDDFLLIPDSSSLDGITSAITVGAWINPEVPAPGGGWIFSRRDPFIGEGFSVLIGGDGRVQVVVRTTASSTVEGSVFDSGPSVITFSQFQHITATADTTTGLVKLFINGNPVTLTAIRGAPTLSGSLFPVNNLFVGRRQSSETAEGVSGGGHYKGLIDEVQIYNRALSAAEIQTLFNSNSPLNLVAAGDFTTPAGDFSVLTKNADGTFTRALKDGTKINFNAQGLQTSVVDRNGNTTSYSYDGSGRLVSITDPAGLITTFTYAGSLLSSVTDPSGTTTSFTSDAAGNLTKVAFPDGSFKSFGYDSKHLMTSETNERGLVVQRAYDTVGRLVGATLPDGSVRSATNAQTVGFADPATGVGTITNPAPVARPADALSRFTDGQGNQQTVKIGKFGAPQRITDPLGQTTLIERNIGNNGGLQNGATFAAGRVGQAFSFDGIDDFVLVADSPSLNPSTAITLAAWVFVTGNQGQHRDIISKDGEGFERQYLLTASDINRFRAHIGVPAGFIFFDGSVPVELNRWYHVTMTYDGVSLRLYVNGVLDGTRGVSGAIIRTPQPVRIGGGAPPGTAQLHFPGSIDEAQIYNRALLASEIQAIFAAGNIGNRTAPASGLVSWWQGEGNVADSIAGHGLPTKITRPNGAVVTMSYDPKGNLFTSTDPVGATTNFTYEANFNQVTSIKDPKNNTTTISYDAKGNPTQIRDSQGNLTQMSYDLRGLLSSVASAVGTPQANTTSFTYDAKGNLITTTDSKGNVTTLAYNSAGNVIRSTDSEGRITEFTYDAFNRLISAIDHNNDVTRYSYDAKGNLIEVIDGKAQATSFTYDVLDRLVSATNPFGFVETFTYDANGNLTSTTNRSSQGITFDYDVLNRLLRKTLPGNQVTAFSYDSVGNLISVIDPDSSVTMAYDLVNRLLSTTASTPSMPPKTISYTYDSNGNRLTMTDPQAGVTNYVYDSLNRLTSLTNPSGRTTSLAYDSLGRRTSMTHGNGVVSSYNYDAASQLLSLVHQLGATTINSFTYTYDKVGNRKSKADNNGTANYTYDTLNRLVQAMNPLPSNPLETYTYDAVGNRINSNQNGTSTFNVANQLTEDASFTYQYDANGNQIRKADKIAGELTSYEYTAENQLVRVVKNGTVINYKFDGLGRRIEKEIIQGPVTNVTRFILDAEDILLELDGSNNIVARYTHGPGIDEPLILEKGGTSFFYHADGLGSITEITNQAGTVLQRYTYSSFGRIESQLDPNFIQPYTFTAREFDPETGLYLYRARSYDPLIGRYLQEDPIGFASGINFYIMVGNNPINLVDPRGLFWGRIFGDKPGDIFTVGFSAGNIVGFGFSFDRIVMPSGQADWFFTLGGGLMVPGIGLAIDRGKIFRLDPLGNQLCNVDFSKPDIEGFSVSGSLDIANPIGVGGEVAVAPFVFRPVSQQFPNLEYSSPLVTVKGGLRIGSPSATLFGNWTWDIGR